MNNKTCKQLKELLKAEGLPTTGRKADLLARIQENDIQAQPVRSTVTISQGNVSITMEMVDDRIETAHLHGIKQARAFPVSDEDEHYNERIVSNGKLLNDITPDKIGTLLMFFTGLCTSYGGRDFVIPNSVAGNIVDPYIVQTEDGMTVTPEMMQTQQPFTPAATAHGPYVVAGNVEASAAELSSFRVVTKIWLKFRKLQFERTFFLHEVTRWRGRCRVSRNKTFEEIYNRVHSERQTFRGTVNFRTVAGFMTLGARRSGNVLKYWWSD